MGKQRFASVLTGMPVRDMTVAVDWYTKFLGRPPDDRPLPDVAEWMLTSRSTLQLVERSGSVHLGILRLEVNDLDEAIDKVNARGCHLVETGEYPGVVRYADYWDPSGNEISLVQAIDSSRRGEEPVEDQR
jgi:glyoxylase I family protein